MNSDQKTAYLRKFTEEACYLGKVPFVVWVLLLLFVLSWLQPYDDTDDAQNKIRSGMVVKTDHRTGCQYLESGFIGGLTPRVDVSGQHIGCR